MKINIFGMGYTGCVSAACLANEGHHVTGIDIDTAKIRMINSGRSPVIEEGLEEAIKRAVDSGRLKATNNDVKHLDQAHASIICVGTPSNENGSLNLESMKRVSEQIGNYLRQMKSYHVVNIRSTVLPGTTEELVVPLFEERSQKKAGLDFGVCMNPEFLREGSSLSDFYNPPFTLIGQLDESSGNVISKMYEAVDAPIIKTKLRVAEMVKYACNAFHALKVSFANEIGNICKTLDIDSHEVMDIFCYDSKLNLSSYYLKPGFAFGGSCLPKDLRAISYKAKELDLELPVLSSILPSNELQIKAAYNLVKKTGKKKVGILGISFKPGTDDLRQSPMVSLIEYLIGKGYEVKIYDKEVSLGKIFGANKDYIENAIPHISLLLTEDIIEVIHSSEVIIVGNKTGKFLEAVTKIDSTKTIVDLVRISENMKNNKNYQGICW